MDSIFLKNRSQGWERVQFHPSFLMFTFFQLLGVPPGPDLGRFLLHLRTDFSAFRHQQANTKLLQQTSKPERTCERTQKANERTNEPASPNERANERNKRTNPRTNQQTRTNARYIPTMREILHPLPTDWRMGWWDRAKRIELAQKTTL